MWLQLSRCKRTKRETFYADVPTRLLPGRRQLFATRRGRVHPHNPVAPDFANGARRPVAPTYVATMALLTQLNEADGSWERFQRDWRTQCEAHGEDFEEYASGSMAVLDVLARNPEPKAGVFALEQEGSFSAVCQANVAMLPGIDGPVLRIRMMILSPDYDLGVKSVDEYAQAIVRLLLGAISLSAANYPARHVKFHMRSPGDRAFFTAIGNSLGTTPVFESVQVRGGWLYITKR